MGLILRQGVKQSTVHVIGVMIGALSTLFIYPQVTYAYGLGRFLIDAAALLAPIMLVGLSILPIRFFPRFRNKESGHHGFLSALMVVMGISSIFFALLFMLFREDVLRIISPEDQGFVRFFNLILPLTVLSGLMSLLYNYTSIFGRIAIPYVFTNLSQKILLPLLLLLYLYSVINLPIYALGVVGMLLFSVLGLIWYLWRIGELHFAPISRLKFKTNAREMAAYSLFGLLGTLGSMLAFKIDSVMISSLVNFQSNGVYNIGLYIANVIGAPALAIASIAGPLISDAWHKGDHEYIAKIYRDSSLMLLIAGCLAFCVVLLCLPDIVDFFPASTDFGALNQVVLFLALAKLVDMASGVNSQIILYSDFYRFNIIAMLLLGVFNFICNYYFIAIAGLGIVGASLATSISILLYNLIKFSFILVKMKMQPFTGSTIIIVLLAAAIFGLVSMLSISFHPLINITIRATIFTIPFFSAIFLFKVSNDFNNYLTVAFHRIKKLVR